MPLPEWGRWSGKPGLQAGPGRRPRCCVGFPDPGCWWKSSPPAAGAKVKAQPVWPFPLTSTHFLRMGLKKNFFFNPKVPVVLTWREVQREGIECTALVFSPRPPTLAASRRTTSVPELGSCPKPREDFSLFLKQDLPQVSSCFALALTWGFLFQVWSAGHPFLHRDSLSLVVQTVKKLPAVEETWVRSLGWEDPLEKGMATCSSILAWRNFLDRGAWWATIRGVTESRTRRRD